MLEVESPSQVEEPPLSKGHLKSFESAGQGPWSNVQDNLWQDWHWQLRHRIRTLEQLERLLPGLTPEERKGVELSGSKLAMGITPYFFNLIDQDDPDCPIRKQVIPHADEHRISPGELEDPCAEDEHSPVPGLVHRYPDRVLLLVTDRCASYCR
ncbi:MAG: lysine 2,3-aminomutase, partial [Verrucomicrobiae bacterium]|nr:lysine 2,3-aminomutase [Verrucomicrobiae bacterium]